MTIYDDTPLPVTDYEIHMEKLTEKMKACPVGDETYGVGVRVWRTS